MTHKYFNSDIFFTINDGPRTLFRINGCQGFQGKIKHKLFMMVLALLPMRWMAVILSG